MITPATEILNQKGTPMFNSDLFSNRPAAGIAGRIFISTDTKEFYRDTGSTWELIGGPGAGTVTGSGTIGTLPIWNGSTSLGNSSLLEASTKFTTTKAFQSSSIYLNDMTAGSGALYYNVPSNRLTLANYNANGNVVIEAGGGANAQFISGTDLSTTFYGSIIRNGGTSSQFLKADGSLDSTAYQPLLTNPVTGTGSSTQVAFWTGSSAIGGNNDLWWDNVNDYLGIKTNSPISELDVVGQGYFHPSVTAAANAGWASSYAFTTATIPATSFSNLGNVFCGAAGINSMTYNGDATFQQANVPAAVIGNNIFRFGSSGLTISLNQGSGLRAFSALTAFNQVQSNFVGTITHLSGVHVLSPFASNQLMNVTNYYGLLINNATERTAFTITNRWGIYQDGALDRNYFNGNVLIKSNVDNGSALQVTGNASISAGQLIFNSAISSFSSYGIARNNQNELQFNGGASGYIFNNAANTANLLKITDGGNLGIGVTPSAWGSLSTAIQLKSGTSIFSNTSGLGGVANNVYSVPGTNDYYIASDFASRYTQYQGQHAWFTAPSGTAGNPITFTQAMTLNASGNLGIGTPNPNAALEVYTLNDPTCIFRAFGDFNMQFRGQTSGLTQLFSIRNSGTNAVFLNTQNSVPLALGVSSGTTGGSTIQQFSLWNTGNISINSTTDTGNKLYLNGSLRIDGQRSATAGGSSGQHLIITLDGIQYKIALLNP